MSPTKILVFSDIHADPVAAAAALDLAAALGADAWVCLGDVVGYGDDPVQAIRRVREGGGVVLRGNHDAALTDDRLLASFSGEARSP